MAFKRNNNVIDSPGNNFATLNPLASGADGTFSHGNLKYVTGNAHMSLGATMYMSNSKWYWETCVVANPKSLIIGIKSIEEVNNNEFNPEKAIGYYSYDGKIFYNGTSESYGTSFTDTHIIGVFLDLEDNKLTFYNNGDAQPAIDLSDSKYNLGEFNFTTRFDDGHGGFVAGATFICNFGQDHTFGGTKTDSAGLPPTDGSPGLFYYQPPEGAKALCTANLPSFDGNTQEHFRAVTYVGNGEEQTITTDMATDMLWIKARDNNTRPAIWDSVRGKHNYLCTSDSFAQNMQASSGTAYPGDVEAFTQTGFELKHSDAGLVNVSGDDVVSWCWKAGGGGGKYNIDGVPFADFANTGLTAGDITPDGMSVNTKAGFSITSFNSGGDNPAASISHGLNQRPDFFMMKQTDGSGAWWVWSSAFSTASDYLYLHMTDGISQLTQQSDMWGSGHDATTIGFKSGWGILTNKQYICYAWHSVPGYSAFGSYEGNNDADGPFVYTGFKPAFLMVKRITGSFSATDGLWTVIDSTRKPFNGGAPNSLYVNNSDVEVTGNANRIDFLSNGFKLADSNNNVNSSEKFIYMAFAEHSM